MKNMKWERLNIVHYPKWIKILLILIHWSSVKEFSCPKAIDFASESYLNFGQFT